LVVMVVSLPRRAVRSLRAHADGVDHHVVVHEAPHHQRRFDLAAHVAVVVAHAHQHVARRHGRDPAERRDQGGEGGFSGHWRAHEDDDLFYPFFFFFMRQVRDGDCFFHLNIFDRSKKNYGSERGKLI
jgi:hypothetical protein